MPRSKGSGPSKSAQIRELLEKDPRMPADSIFQELASRGVKVSKNLIYLQKVQMKRRRGRARRAAAMSAGQQAGIKDPVALILKVKSLAHEAGGLKHLKELVDVLAS